MRLGAVIRELRGVPSAWSLVLVLCVAVRVATPLAVLVAHDHELPGLPRYTYDPRPGDAYGYYSAMRALLAAWQRPVALATVVAIAAAAAAVVLAARRRRRPGWAIVATGLAVGSAGAVLSLKMASAGAPTIGWPLVWSVPLLPYRAFGLPLGPDLAFAVGLAISLLANAATVVAVAVLGRRATGRELVGLGAAAGLAVWPLLTGVLVGHRAWENGTWLVDTGLHLYSEPVSTALVIGALTLLVASDSSEAALALSGVLFSFASVVRLTNALIAAVALAVVAVRSPVRSALVFGAAVATMIPVELAYWSKGYTHLPAAAGGLPPRPFALRYVRIAWSHSLLWRPQVLLLLVPLALVGTLAVRQAWRRWLLWGAIGVTAGLYSVYAVTNIHPRFLYVVFPLVLVLWFGGVSVLVEAVRGRAGAPAT